eukprot:TRINITY_DN283_c0_g1_i3.p1 TRINITY_DN283_c0_g1~~TRINITY_DN283_c0_g1_i3.p1  ORF type:complete len:491 (-),score=129.60 TRINITY_DN283_c0_g1_i3:81-1553(-)
MSYSGSAASAPAEVNPPSKVLHVRNVAPETSNDELLGFVQQFGGVQGIVFLAKFNQALIEVDSVATATSIVTYNRTNPVYMRNRELRFSYSKSQSINSQQLQGGPHSARQGPQPGPAGHHILLCTIYNPLFNITVEVLYAIMSPYGNLQRIVIFNKNGVQALVEFDNPASAFQAKTALDGKDIYAGSCTLKIEYSKADKLNVHANTDKTRDYTNPSLPTGPAAPGMMGYPAAGAGPSDYYGRGMGGMSYGGEGMGRTVLIVYGLDEARMNVDAIFNVFCLYGNVVKIKLLPTKKGSALVQMGDNNMADMALQHLNNAELFGQHLQVQYSKHPYIAESRPAAPGAEVAEPEPTTSKDFSTSPLNRFTRANPNAYKHIYKPTATLYFSNLPKDFTEPQLITMFTGLGAVAPSGVKFFSLAPSADQAGKEERRVGLLEFQDVQQATEALALANNSRVSSNTLRLSFSTNTIHQHNTQQLGAPSPSLSAISSSS